jgi:hypothetical protein
MRPFLAPAVLVLLACETPTGIREVEPPNGNAMCIAALEDFCGRFAGRCPTYEERVNQMRGACPQRHFATAYTAEHCVGVYRAVESRDLLLGGTKTFFRRRGASLRGDGFRRLPGVLRGRRVHAVVGSRGFALPHHPDRREPVRAVGGASRTPARQGKGHGLTPGARGKI